MDGNWALALHGGAGARRDVDHSPALAHMRGLLKGGGARLAAGAPALDVVQAMIEALEECGFHTAGKGTSPTRDGRYETDAAIMNGADRAAGAVSALEGFRHPVAAARAVMDKTPHVLLTAHGAARVADKAGLERIRDPEAYYRPSITAPIGDEELAHGTVGAVACDSSGQLAAATSTGGLLHKTPGRVGDSPIIGLGTWADERVAVSCTGQGEYFMRTAAAADVSARIKYGEASLEDAAQAVVDDVQNLGGDGGLIAVDIIGNVAMPFASSGMKRGFANASGQIDVAVFGT